VLPPNITYTNLEDFSDGVANLLTAGSTGAWTVQTSRLTGTAVGAGAVAYDLARLPGVTNLQTSSYLEILATVNTLGQAGVIFDQYALDDFKFAVLDAPADRVLIGHYTARSGWVVDQSVSKVIDAGVDYALGVTLRGTTVSVTVNSQVVMSNAFNAVTVDGHFGLLTRGGAANFDNVSFKTNDSAFLTATNVAPVAANDNATTTRNTAVTIAVLANDTDSNGDTLTVTSFTQPANGLVSFANGIATFTPATDFVGATTFTYVATDGQLQSNVATVTVQVNAIANTAPVAGNDTATTTKGTPVNIAVLANDTDANGDALSVSSFTQPANGTVTFTNGIATYTPATGFVGTNTFTYVATDGQLQSNVATVTVQVNQPANTAPVAVNDTTTTSRSTPVNIAVLANDTDANGDVLSVSSFTQPANGAVTFANGIASYLPRSGFTGTDTFTYRASDGQSQSNMATVTVQVNAKPAGSVTTTAARSFTDSGVSTSTILIADSFASTDNYLSPVLTRAYSSDFQDFLHHSETKAIELFSVTCVSS